MTITYRWVNDDDGNQSRILKTDGNIRTCFKPGGDSQAAEDYQSWLDEGNTPLPADSE